MTTRQYTRLAGVGEAESFLARITSMRDEIGKHQQETYSMDTETFDVLNDAFKKAYDGIDTLYNAYVTIRYELDKAGVS